MKALFIVLLSFTIAGNLNAQPGAPIERPVDIFKTGDTFLSYIGKTLGLLSSNYTAFDDHSKVISKLEFLRKVNSGDYLFIKLSSTDVKEYFKLYKLNQAQKKVYSELIYAYARSYYDNYKWVGKKFPVFSFTDINGNRYNNKNTYGKIILIKCWFIGCHACVEEMPDLNTLVESYKNRRDILFISLAPDPKLKIQAFFKDRRFDYVKIPNVNNFIENTLKVYEYPTHFIVNKQGIIVNVVNDSNEIRYTLSHDL
jgi:thiol-disulfide isomerase/thioredoxin